MRHDPWKYGMAIMSRQVKSATVPPESGSSFLGSHALREKRNALKTPPNEPALITEMQRRLTNGMKRIMQRIITATPSIRWRWLG